MKRLIPFLVLLRACVMPVCATELKAPTVPSYAADLMPQTSQGFLEGFLQILSAAMQALRPDLREAGQICGGICAVAILTAVLMSVKTDTDTVVQTAGVAAVGLMLVRGTHSMVSLGAETVVRLSDYGKLLIPVMTTALAAEGGVSSSTALYAGAVGFSVFLTSLLSNLLIPLVYAYLAFSVANAALEEQTLKQLRDFVKSVISWVLKTVLTVFTTYMSISGVVSGTTDAASLKMTKMTISGMVPVVGGILSDASEAVLVGAGLAKNAAGIYGILAILAIYVRPFVKIGAHYLMIKFTAAVCGIFGSKRVCGIVGDFATAMGLLLALTGALCIMLLISTICFMRGMGR